LVFNEDKTRIVHLEEGFDFLGFNLRRYRRGDRPGKLLIKPSTEAVRRIRKRLTNEMRRLRGSNARAVIARLNPIIRGWAAYYRGVVSSKVFHKLDAHVWWLVYRWARHRHSNKSKTWVATRYFGKFNKARNDRWVFGDRHSGAYLHKFIWTRILRHRIVRHGASPDDPKLGDYWAWRRRKGVPLPINKTTQELIDSQDGRCVICGGLLYAIENRPQNPPEWEKWLATRTAVITTATRPGKTEAAEPRLAHADCRPGSGPTRQHAHQPTGLA
jgi:RNA-directed DNA polymerase